MGFKPKKNLKNGYILWVKSHKWVFFNICFAKMTPVKKKKKRLKCFQNMFEKKKHQDFLFSFFDILHDSIFQKKKNKNKNLTNQPYLKNLSTGKFLALLICLILHAMQHLPSRKKQQTNKLEPEWHRVKFQETQLCGQRMVLFGILVRNPG